MNVTRGALLAGRFRTHTQLNTMTASDQRNTLIVEMAAHSNQPVSHYQSLNDNDLSGAAAVMVFLLIGGSRTAAQLKTMSADDQRNTLIVGLGSPEFTGQDLQRMSNLALVSLGMGGTHPGSLQQGSFVQGVLVAGEFATFGDVLKMSPDNQRNTLITAIGRLTSQPGGAIQALNDFELAGAGAATVFLRVGCQVPDTTLKATTLDGQRNTTIFQVGLQTHLGSALQGIRTLDVVGAALGIPPASIKPVTPSDVYKFTIDSMTARRHKADGNHSDSDWLTIIVSIGDAATKTQPRVLPPKTFQLGGAIKDGDVLHGPFATDDFVAEDTDAVIITYVVTNLGSTDAEDQGKQAAEVTDKLVLIATPIAADGIGTFVAGSPAEDPGIGQQITDEINRSFSNLSDLFLGFVGLHSDPPNCNGMVLIDTLTFLPGELAKAANIISSRDYTGPQTDDRCGGAPESTINFHIDRFSTGGISPPEA